MAQRKNRGPSATILLPELSSEHGRMLLERALKSADTEMKGDFRGATFGQILKNRGAVSAAFRFCGFDVEMDKGAKRVIVTVDEDDPEPPLTPQHYQTNDLDEDDDSKYEIPEELGGADERVVTPPPPAPQREPDPQPDEPVQRPDNDKDEDPQAQKAREWNIFKSQKGGKPPRRRR